MIVQEANCPGNRGRLIDPCVTYTRTAYARVARGKDRFKEYVVIQYWLAYFYNDWANIHQMDWEQVSVYVHLSKKAHVTQAQARECAFSAHFGGIFSPWNEVSYQVSLGDHVGDHPVVYVAQGSHANYPKPGVFRPFMRVGGLKLTTKDLAFLGGGGESLDHTLRIDAGQISMPKVICIPEPCDSKYGLWSHCCGDHDCQSCNGDHKCAGGRRQGSDCDFDKNKLCRYDFRWLNLKGLWGSPGGILGGDASPQSPTSQAAWKDPFAWLVDSCERIDPTRSEPERILMNLPTSN
jgi:hypothetical protein